MSYARGGPSSMYAYKRKNIQKKIWRPINSQAQLKAGNGRGTSSVTKEEAHVENGSTHIFENANEGMESLNLVSKSDSSMSAITHTSSKPFKSFVSVKHVKSEVEVVCAVGDQGSLSSDGDSVDEETSSEQDDAHQTVLEADGSSENGQTVPEANGSSEINQTVLESGGSSEDMITSEGTMDVEKTVDSTVDLKNENKEKNPTEITGEVKNDENITKTEIHQEPIEVGSLKRFIRGGNVPSMIKKETGATLNFASSTEGATVVVNGPSVSSVSTASKMIKEILLEVVESPCVDYSHFISLPLAHHLELVEKLANFQNSILEACASPIKDLDDSDSDAATSSGDDRSSKLKRTKLKVNLKVEDDGHVSVEILEDNKTALEFCGDSSVKKRVKVKLSLEGDVVHVKLNAVDAVTGEENAKRKHDSQSLKRKKIDKSIFIKPETFHLTVLMLKLWNKERLSKAIEILHNVLPQVNGVLEGRPLSVSLKGLELMRGNPAKAHVLYARVNEVGGGGRLELACKTIINAFKEAGLVLEKDARSPLKLHATLMNSRHRKGKGRRFKRDNSFDARPIIDQYGSYHWGEYVISEVHLSQRFAYDDNGYYHCCTSIPFPEACEDTSISSESVEKNEEEKKAVKNIITEDQTSIDV